MAPKTNRRGFIKTGLAATAGAAAGPMLFSPRKATAKPLGTPIKGRRVVLLGFDGVEPGIVDTMMAAGRLPSLAKLREGGAYKRLTTANPPQSPTAWTSFATCKNPGQHGIYDFLRRDPATYMPQVGLGETMHPKLNIDGHVVRPAKSVTHRQGETFWSAADRHGVRARVLTIPFIYPPDNMNESAMLCGLGVPDIRGTSSTCYYFSDSFTDEELQGRMSGGDRVPLRFSGETAQVRIKAARDTTKRGLNYVEAPVRITRRPDARKVTIDAAGRTLELAEGDWSDWVEWTFDVTAEFSVRAISRFYVLEAGDRTRVYMTCLQFHPDDPYVAFTEPHGYAQELEQRYGLYKTVGWAYDTHALRQDALTEEAFLDDVRRTMNWRERLALDELDTGEFDMLLAGWTATDRVGHMFWRFRDPEHPLYEPELAKTFGEALEETYVKMDGIVGRAMERARPDDLFMVLSDHGFHSFRQAFSPNTWLIRNGYLAVKGGGDYTDAKYLRDYEWGASKAYGLGLGSIYLNIKGREGEGTVDPAEAGNVIDEIRGKLLEERDPDTGAKIFREVYTRDVYSGASKEDAPDLQLGYAEGYQTAKPSAAGAAPEALIAPNDDKWSGEHAASDVAFTPGMLFSNGPVADNPHIMDLGVTALAHLGLEAPDDYEGKSLLPS